MGEVVEFTGEWAGPYSDGSFWRRYEELTDAERLAWLEAEARHEGIPDPAKHAALMQRTLQSAMTLLDDDLGA